MGADYFPSLEFKSSSVMAAVCSIGFHSTFLKRATTDIGMYVAIKNGKVNRYSIFLYAGAFIRRHSVTAVVRQIMNISPYIAANEYPSPAPARHAYDFTVKFFMLKAAVRRARDRYAAQPRAAV